MGRAVVVGDLGGRTTCVKRGSNRCYSFESIGLARRCLVDSPTVWESLFTKTRERALGLSPNDRLIVEERLSGRNASVLPLRYRWDPACPRHELWNCHPLMAPRKFDGFPELDTRPSPSNSGEWRRRINCSCC